MCICNMNIFTQLSAIGIYKVRLDSLWINFVCLVCVYVVEEDKGLGHCLCKSDMHACLSSHAINIPSLW